MVVCDPSGSEKERDGGVVVNIKKAVRLNDGGLRWSEKVKVADGRVREKEVVCEGGERKRGKNKEKKKYHIPYFILYGVCIVFDILCSVIKTQIDIAMISFFFFGNVPANNMRYSYRLS